MDSESGHLSVWDSIEPRLAALYGSEAAAELCADLRDEIAAFHSQRERGAAAAGGLSERDASLIVYADTVITDPSTQSPLQSLAAFLDSVEAVDFLSAVHLLPFYPWDTDRGFSVKNFYEVDPQNGSWEDVAALADSHRLMFDFVANHASIDNPLIQNALIARHLPNAHPSYAEVSASDGFVLAFSKDDRPSDEDIAALTRPRAAPVLSPYYVEERDGALSAKLGEPSDTEHCLGSGFVWTTFSRPKNDDGGEATRQVDLNFKNPKVFLESVKILLFYCARGASLIRLDAIGYLWKKLGSSSIHEPETHALLQVLHMVMQEAAPEVITVAEVNELQDRVLEYLGDPEAPESDLVYQFSHFPLAVNAVQTESSTFYEKWLTTLEPFNGRQFITVLGSHDGLGMKPSRGLLPNEERAALEKRLVEEHGGRPNHASLSGGEKIIYEVCGTPWDLINRRDADESFELQLSRYLAVAALGLIPRGLPAFYINGLLAASNYEPTEGLDENRTMNRERFLLSELQRGCKNDGRMSRVLHGIRRLLTLRAEQPAFNPSAPPLQVLPLEEGFVSALLPAVEEHETIHCIVSIRSAPQMLSADLESNLPCSGELRDVLSGEQVGRQEPLSFESYQVRWVRRV